MITQCNTLIFFSSYAFVGLLIACLVINTQSLSDNDQENFGSLDNSKVDVQIKEAIDRFFSQ